jgi:hypothetical protein
MRVLADCNGKRRDAGTPEDTVNGVSFSLRGPLTTAGMRVIVI